MGGLRWVEMAGMGGLALHLKSNKLVASNSTIQNYLQECVKYTSQN